MKNWFKSLNLTGKVLFFTLIFLLVWEMVSLIVPSIWTISEAMSKTGMAFLFIPYIFTVLGGHFFFMRDHSARLFELIILIIISVLFLTYSIIAMLVPLADPFTMYLIDHMGIIYIFGTLVGALFWYRKRGE